MKQGEPSLKESFSKASKNFPFWYLLFMLLLVWLWQAAVGQYAIKTILYSEFKQHLKNKEVVECVVKEDAVEGKIQPKTGAGPDASKAYMFRAVKIEDPKLVDELETAGVKFTGARPNFAGELIQIGVRRH